MLTKKSAQSQAGFSLLEMMIATLLLGVAVAGVSSSFIQAARYVQPERPFASDLSQTFTEMGPDLMSLFISAYGGGSGSELVLPVVPGLLSYTVQNNVTTVAGKDYKKVETITSWAV